MATASIAQPNDDGKSVFDPLILAELKRIASRYMRRERHNHTLQPTALVNEAYLRLVKSPGAAFEDRTHFFALASQTMRHVLVDHARARRSSKRGGPRRQIMLHEALGASEDKTVDILAIDEALSRLAKFEPRAARVVELHYFSGLSFVEIGVYLGLSEKTIRRDWDDALTWLQAEFTKPTKIL